METAFSGLISADTTWEGKINITGSVKIENGAKLTIKPGTEITIASGKNIRIWAADGGKIEAIGTIDNKITFKADTEGSDCWKGIEFSGDLSSAANNNGYVSGSRIEGFEIRNAVNAISITSQGLTIKDGGFFSNGTSIRLKDSKNIFIGQNSFAHKGEGIATDYEGGGKHSNIFMQGNAFIEGNAGINIMPNQRDIHNIYVDGNKFGYDSGVNLGGGGYGSYIGEVFLRNNIFGNKSGGVSIRAYSWNPRETALVSTIQANAVIEGNLFYQSSGVNIGYSDGNGKIAISGNYFKDHGSSGSAIKGFDYIQANYGDGRNEYTISNNVFDGIGSAIDIQSSKSEINNNTFKQLTGYAVKYLKTSSDVRNNNITEHQGSYVFHARDKTSLSAPITVGANFYDESTGKKAFADDDAKNFEYRIVKSGGSMASPSTTNLSALLPGRGIDGLSLSAISILENIDAGSGISTLSTIDPDEKDTHSYALVSGTGSTDNAVFSISGNQLKIKDSPDFETKSSYSVRLRTTDSGGLEFDKELILSVSNINERPTNLTLSSNTFNENIAAGTAVATLSTTDPDSDDTFSYALVSGTGGTDDASFSISGNQLKIKDSPDFETKSSYSVRLRTTDSGGLVFDKAVALSVVHQNNSPTGTPTLSGTLKAGQVITIDKTPIQDADNFTGYTPDFKYSWEASTNGTTWTSLTTTDATDNNNTYTLTTAEVGKQIRGLLTYIDGYGTRESIASIASESVKHGIWSEEPPDNIGLSTLASSFDSLPSWIEPGTFTQSYVYSISGGKLTPSENNDQWNNKLSITRKVAVDIGVYLSVSFDLKYDSNLLSPFNIHQDTRPYMIIPALVANSNNYATGGIESVLENSKGSSNTYDFNAWTYGGVLSNFNNAPLKSERSPIVFQANDLIKIDYKLGMTDTGLSYIWQSAKSTISGEVGQAYYEFFDPSYKSGQSLKVDLSFARQSGTESVDNLKISANFVNSAPTSLSLDNSSLDENISAGSRIAILSSSDPDPSDTFTYSLVPGLGSPDNEVFTIVGDELIINVSPDYEIQNSYSIRVRTTDQDGLSADNTFFLTVNDLPEAPPAPIYIIETVIDGSDIGEDGSGSGVYGLYHIFGLEGRNSSVLAVTDADLETDASVDSSSLTTAALPLLTAAGALFPSTNTPIAIRKDGSNLELLYKPSITSTTYQTQDFSLSTGKAIGAPAPLSSSLQSFEIPYDQDLDGDGITGPALTITETIDAADTGAGGDGTATYGLYRISGISGKSTSQLALSQAGLEEGRTIAQSELDPLLPLLTTRGTPLPAAWLPRAIRKDDIDGRIELLYRPTTTATSHQTQDFSLTTGRAIGAPTPLNKSLQSFEVAYDEDLDLDGIIGLSLSVQEVVDAADQGPGGDGSATYGLYSISGINGSSAAALAVADADLEDGLLVPQSELSTLVPLLTSAGKSLPTAWQPLAIRQDAANIELLYKPTKTAATYQTQDFSLTTGKAIGKPTAALSSLISMEVPYAQDFNKDGVLGINITEIGETTAVAGTAAKDRLTLTSMDIGYAGTADDTLLVAPDVSSNDPITMVGGPGNDTYTAKAGAFLVVYDLGTTKDTKDLLTGLPGTVKQWSLYRVDTNDFLLQHSNTSTAVLLVDPLGKASAGNKLETIRFSSGAAQTMATLTNARTGILSTEPAISYADLPDRFGYDIAFAYGISQEAGPLSLKTELSSNLAMVV